MLPLPLLSASPSAPPTLIRLLGTSLVRLGLRWRVRLALSITACLLIIGAPAVQAAAVATGTWEHALSAYQPPKYPRGFSHFDYVNPAAPKGGTLKLGNPDRRSSFDKFNPYTVKGVAPAAMTMFIFESLAFTSMDEPMAMYGLLAEEILVAPDLSSISDRKSVV